MAREPMAGKAGAPDATDSRSDWYFLALLTFVLAASYADRSILSAVVDLVKQEFAISDRQMGLLTGIAFAAVYTILPFPIAWLADRGNRKKIIMISIAVWSLGTIGSGLARNPTDFFCAQLLVGAGEAGVAAPAYSLIIDLINPRRRSTAYAIFGLGVPLGSAAGLIIGGQMAAAWGWRMPFIVMGSATLLLLPLLGWTARNPVRGQWDAPVSPSLAAARLSFLASIRMILQNRTVSLLLAASAAVMFVGFGISQWLVPFLQRSHGVSLTSATTYFAAISIFLGVSGTLLGGYSADLLGRRSPRWALWSIAVALAIGFPFAVLTFSASTSMVAMLAFCVPAFVVSFFVAPSISMIQGAVDPRTRAMAGALFTCVIYVIGIGGGPFVTGWISDLLTPRYGAASLQQALLIMSAGYLMAIYLFFRAGRTLPARTVVPPR